MKRPRGYMAVLLRGMPFIALTIVIALCVRAQWTSDALHVRRRASTYTVQTMPNGLLFLTADWPNDGTVAVDPPLYESSSADGGRGWWRFYYGRAREDFGRFGFRVASFRDPTGYGERWLLVPFWLLVAAPAALAVPLLIRWRRQHYRRRRGLCLSCGYDLRASAARCPECGATSL